MTSQAASIQSNIEATPPIRNKVNRLSGRIRIFQSTVTVSATPPAIGETITWGSLPKNANVLGYLSQLRFSAGAAAQTLNLGDSALAARHLVATSVTAAGSAVPEAAAANGAAFETSDDSTAATNNCRLISTVAGATLTPGQVLTLRMAYTLD